MSDKKKDIFQPFAFTCGYIAGIFIILKITGVL